MKPKACFTASLIALFFLSGLQSVFAQYDYWSVPAPASDSVADNRNAIIKELPFNNEFSNFIFWERSEDSISTDIYYRNLYTQDEPEVLVTGGGFHYTNPRIISTYNYEDDTLFFLFYQSDQNGNADIYYKFYTNDGFSEPVLFAGTQADETHFRCNDAGYMTWQEGNKIKTRRLFKDYYHPYFTLTDPVTLDSLNVSEPEIPSDMSGYFPYVSWLKTDADSISIWYSYDMGGSWSDPILFFGPGMNTSSDFAISSCIYLGNLIFTWDNLAGSEHSIYACNGEDDCFVSEFHQQSSFLPVMSDYIIPVGNFN